MRLLSSLFILLIANVLHAQLTIEITQGSDNPFNLGIISQTSIESDSTNIVASIITNDLLRTGDITIISEADPGNISEEDLPFTFWKLMKLDFIAITNLQRD